MSAQKQSFADSIIKTIVNLPDTQKVEALNVLSRTYRVSQPNEALLLNFMANKLSIKNNYISGRIESLQLIGYTYHYHQVNDSAIYFYNKALKLAEKHDKKMDVAICHGSLAISYHQQNLYEKSIEYYKLALEDFKKLKDKPGQAKVYANIGNVYLTQGSSKKALEAYLESIEICEEIKDDNLMATNLSNIAIIYQNLDENQKALEYQFRVLAMNKGQNSGLIADSYNNIGLSYKLLGKLDSAEYYFEKAINMADSLGIKDKYSIALNNLGTLFFDSENFDKALDLFNRAVKISEETGDVRAIAFYQNNIAAIYFKTGKHLQAVEKAANSLELALSINSKNEIRESYHLLSEANYELGEYQKAFDYLKLFNQLSDSLQSENALKEIEKLKSRFELSEKEKELKIKNQKIEIYKKNEKIDKLNQIAMSVSIGFLVLLAIVLILYQRRQLKKNKLIQEKESALMEAKLRNSELEKRHLVTELEYKNQEITNFAIHIVEKNDFLENLKNIAENDSSKLKTLISQNLNIEKEREEFRAQVEQINQGFFLKLNEQFPSLTKHETRLAALLRLNLSSKEISTLLNISPSSVDMNRHRLRKKINVDAEIPLSEFFKTL